MDLVNSLLLYDETISAPTITEIITWTAVILIVSNVIFIVLCALFGVDSSNTMDQEKDKEYEKWSKDNISPWAIAGSELLNSSIYSPVAEEITFRFLLLKLVCVKMLKLDFWTSNIIQAVIFGSLHISNITFTTQTKNYTYLQAISAGISGIVSGYVYRASNSIIPSLLAHILNNASAGMSEVIGYIQFRRKNPTNISTHK